MRDNTSTLNAAFAPRRLTGTRLDYTTLQRFFMGVGVFLVLMSPFSRDPLAFAACGILPWVILRLIGSAYTPAAVAYYILWQWLQSFARVVQSLVDGETLAGGIYGPAVERAFWYSLASLLVIAIAFRLVLLGQRQPPTAALAVAHRYWRVRDLFLLYLVSVVVSAICTYLSHAVPSLEQPFQAAGYVKVLALVMLFSAVMTSGGKGWQILVGVLLVEVLSGFTGLFSDFKSVFIYLAVTAVAARIRWNGTMAVATVALATILIGLGLFWTSVKGEFRQYATGSSESQTVRTTLSSRFEYLGGKAADASDIDWDLAAYALLTRLAYIDIFGSVIGVQDVAPEPGYMRQWTDGLEHVLKPRFLFPNKPPLVDTEVFVRLARGDVTESLRGGTSISVGYMAENYVDLGFPGMLVGVFALASLAALICRYFATRPVPWMMREGVVLAILYQMGHDGVEISLPKMLGTLLMTFAVWSIIARWGFPVILKWLGRPVSGSKARFA